MRDCDHCFHDRNGDCSRLSCIGFKPVGSIDAEVLKNAADSIDKGRHPRSKHSSRLFAESEERVKAAEQERAGTSRQEPLAARMVASRASVEAALRAWRREQSLKEHIPAYRIFPDTTLKALSSASIQTKLDLMFVPGIGPKTYEKYADAIFQILHN